MSVYVNTCPQLMCYGVHSCIYTMVETSIFVEVDAMFVLQLLASLARRFAIVSLGKNIGRDSTYV